MSFNTDLEYSLNGDFETEINNFYYRTFPNIKSITNTDMSFQKLGIDKIINLNNGISITVEEKRRRKGYVDILLEYVSNNNSSRDGWVMTCEADYLIYIIENTNKIYVLPMPLLKLAWLEHKEEWIELYTVYGTNKNYKSLCAAIPVGVLINAIAYKMIHNLK